jgi:D-glycero-alpha-D-manno-heptose-7-phosphate kinase
MSQRGHIDDVDPEVSGLKLKVNYQGYCKTPVRLSLAGGGTDVEPFSSSHGSKVLNFAIKEFVFGEIQPNFPNIQAKPISLSIVSNSIGSEMQKNRVKSNFEILLEQKLTECYEPKLPFAVSISLRTPFSPGSGLGASSSIVLTAVHLLCQLMEDTVNPLDLAKRAFEIERTQMGIAGGFQDQFACALGGICYLTAQNGVIEAEKLKVSSKFIQELEASMILVNLGVSRSGETIIEKQISNVTARKSSTIHALRVQLKLAHDMKHSVLNENLTEVGKLLQRAWLAKREFAVEITSQSIDKLISQLLNLGALGAKLSGAGGGGHMLCLVPNESRTRESIEHFLSQEGYTFRTVEISHLGSVAWT